MLHKGHPKGLYLLFTVEMWERFSYYGMRALLIFYLTKTWLEGGLAFDEQTGNLIYGFFTGFVYFTPIIGGWLADNYLGQRKSISIGAFTMMAGEFCLAFEQSKASLFLGLALLIIGNDFFKPNISVLVGQLYEPNDKRKDAAFTIFYMGINLGALFAPLITGYLAINYSYNYGFLAAGIGMLFGQIAYQLLGNKMLGDIGKIPSSKSKDADGKNNNHPLTKEEKDRTKVIFIIVFFVIFFFAGFEQAGSSFSLYTDKFINRDMLGFTIPAEWFQSVNPLFIILLAPLITTLWNRLSDKNKEPNIPIKMGVGMILLGLGFIMMVGAVIERGGDIADSSVKANIAWLIFAYFLHTVGELCLSPIGLSMVSKLAPIKLASLLMGVWLMSSFIANIAAGFLASSVSQLGAYTIFSAIALVSIILGLVLLAINKRLFKMMHLSH